MNEQSGEKPESNASNFLPKTPHSSPKDGGVDKGKPAIANPPKVPGISDPKPRRDISIWKDGHGYTLWETPRGVPGRYRGQVVDVDYIDQDTDKKRGIYEATMVVGDLNGYVGIGIGRAKTRRGAISVAKKRAVAKTFKVPRVQTTVAKVVTGNSSGVSVAISPSKPGAGITAPKSVKLLLGLAGVSDAKVTLAGEYDNKSALASTENALRVQTRSTKEARGRYIARRAGAKKKYAITKQASPKRKKTGE